MNIVEEHSVNCPYCGELFTIVIDLSAGNQQYTEDCSICCQPVFFDICIDPPESTVLINARREND
ncbi:MAG: CPXCG motif-containing cysteine-rich protein [Gammaproteobacteria bacterium]